MTASHLCHAYLSGRTRGGGGAREAARVQVRGVWVEAESFPCFSSALCARPYRFVLVGTDWWVR